jgi:hypothetical protein
VFDLPPAVIETRPVLDLALYVNGENCGPCLPGDFLSLPAVLRATVAVADLLPWLPEPYRLLPDHMLADVLYAAMPGLPGPLMAGGAKKAWLYTASGQFVFPGSWNKRDNIIHGLGPGGWGRGGFISGLGERYTGGGGGGAAWAANVNREYASGFIADLQVGEPGATINSAGTATWFEGTGVLLAAAGGNTPAVSGGVANGGTGGQLSSSVGDFRSSGGNGSNGTSLGSNEFSVGHAAAAGVAGGPNGNGEAATVPNGGRADAGFGGAAGGVGPNDGDNLPGGDGVDGPAGGFNPKKKINAGPGGGGCGGLSLTVAGFQRPTSARNGKTGGQYGGGGGGGCVDLNQVNQTVLGSGAAGRQGCVFLINNASQ